MVTMIIAGFVVGILSVILKGAGGKVRDAQFMKESNKAFLTPIIELESMGFQVIGRDPAIKATIEQGRRNKAAILKGAEPVTIDETIAECAADPEAYKTISRGISAIKSHCNVDIVPDLRAEVARYKAIIKDYNNRQGGGAVMYSVPDYKSNGRGLYKAMKDDLTPYYVSDQLEALDGLINSLYARIELLRDEREATFNPLQQMEIDEKINKLLLQAAKKEQEADKLRSKYANKWRV